MKATIFVSHFIWDEILNNIVEIPQRCLCQFQSSYVSTTNKDEVTWPSFQRPSQRWEKLPRSRRKPAGECYRGHISSPVSKHLRHISARW